MYNGHILIFYNILKNKIVSSATTVLAVQGDNGQLLPDQHLENWPPTSGMAWYKCHTYVTSCLS